MAENIAESRIAGPTVITTSNATFYTVPSNHRIVTKQIIVCNTNGVDAWFSIGLNGTAATAANCLFFQLPIAAFDTIVFDTQIVLEAAETIHVISDRGAINITAVGWDHTLS
jgi:hypothetical protein